MKKTSQWLRSSAVAAVIDSENAHVFVVGAGAAAVGVYAFRRKKSQNATVITPLVPIRRLM
jgi:hypothetical protein